MEAQTKVTEQKDIPYKTGVNLTADEQTRCKLDVFAPQDAKNLPVLLWFHGGALKTGTKSELTNASRALAGEGFVVAAASYRFSPSVTFPAYAEDAAAAVAFMVANAGKFGGNPKKFFIGGYSAGGYLAALISTDPRYLKAQNINVSDIAGLISISGQMTTHFTVRAERAIPESAVTVDDAAPLHYASHATPPTLLLYCDHDMTLRVEENTYFAAALQAAGQKQVKTVLIPGRNHGNIIAEIDQPGDAVRQEILTFCELIPERGGTSRKGCSPFTKTRTFLRPYQGATCGTGNEMILVVQPLRSWL